MKINVYYADGEGGSGTGFIFKVSGGDAGDLYFLVTNRHVIEGASRVEFRFTKSTPDGHPNHEEHHICHFETDSYNLIAYHPDAEVDLCIIGLGPALQSVLDSGHQPYIKGFTVDQIADQQDRLSAKAIENVLMIGYPNGLVDEIHNVPIVRRGVTATPIFLDHNGRPEFVVDAACFPGSSGSPIIRYDHGCFIEDGETKFGTRAQLLGILYAGPYVQPDGSVQTRHIPTGAVTEDDIKVMINLGYCIRAEEILGFYQILESWGAILD